MANDAVTSHHGSNPFDDPAASERSLETDTVLAVGRNATLTLGTDTLVVLDEALKSKSVKEDCFGLLATRSAATRAIPFHNVLWADLTDFNITVHYADATGSKARGRKVQYIHYTLPDRKLEQAQRWVERLMRRAYPPSTMRQKRIKVLVNPFGGQGNAQKIWTREVEPIFAAAHCEIDVERTTHHGHAVEIAKNLNIDAYDVVACASGDGLPHEVFNGLSKHKHARRALRQIAVCQIPCGSGNAMSLNLNGTDSPSLAALEIVKGTPTPLDLVAITQGNNHYYSFLSQAVGIVAESDLGTESLRWMGPMRFTWGLLVRIMGQTQYPAELSMAIESDDKHAIRETYRRTVDAHLAHPPPPRTLQSPLESDPEEPLPSLRFGNVTQPLPTTFTTQDLPTLGNFYAGNMCYMSPDAPFFVTALPSDGKMDLVTVAGDIPRLTALSMMIEVANGTFMRFPDAQYRKVWAYRIVPRARPAGAAGLRTKLAHWLGGGGRQTEGMIAIDGERVPFEPFQAELVPGLGTVVSKRGPLYEFDGPK